MKLLNLFNNEEEENKFFEGIIQKIKEGGQKTKNSLKKSRTLSWSWYTNF